MTDNRRISTSDLVDAADHAESRRDMARDAGQQGEDTAQSDRREQSDRRDQSDGHEPLFAAGDADGYRTRWGAIQTGFVDEPRRAVEEADALVAEVITHLAQGFAGARQRLEGEWERNDKVSTEDLRQSMRRYRSFFDRLLNL